MLYSDSASCHWRLLFGSCPVWFGNLWCSASPGFFVLLAMAVYTGVTVNYYGKRYGSWRFSWSYIMGWVAVVLTFFSGAHLHTGESDETRFIPWQAVFFSSRPLEGIFYMCAYRMHECPRNSNSRWPAIEVVACSHMSTGQRIAFQRS